MADTPKLLNLDTYKAGNAQFWANLKAKWLDASGKIRAALIPIGSGLKEADGKIVFDADNINIDASKVNIATASTTVKGLVSIGDGINVDANGQISIALATEEEVRAAVTNAMTDTTA